MDATKHKSGHKERNRLLWEQYAKDRSVDVRNELVEAYLRIASVLAQKFYLRNPQRLDFDDLEAEAMMALIDAVEKFDQSRGTAFTTYAYRVIYRRMGREGARSLFMPGFTGEKCLKMREVQNQLGQRLNREPTAEELAREFGQTVETTEKMLAWKQDCGNPDLTLEKNAFSSEPDPAASACDRDNLRAVRCAISVLRTMISERNFQIFLMRYRDGAKLDEIAEKYGISKERARQVLTNTVMPKLKKLVEKS